jgi:hypothetical protein
MIKKPAPIDPGLATAMKEFHPIKIIHHSNSLKSVTLEDGTVVKRQNKYYCGPEYGIVPTAPMDNHFIFEDPGYKRGIVGRSKFMCTCGSLAVIVGANVYAKDASPTSKEDGSTAGQLIVCWHHATFGKHVTGES